MTIEFPTLSHLEYLILASFAEYEEDEELSIDRVIQELNLPSERTRTDTPKWGSPQTVRQALVTIINSNHLYQVGPEENKNYIMNQSGFEAVNKTRKFYEAH